MCACECVKHTMFTLWTIYIYIYIYIYIRWKNMIFVYFKEFEVRKILKPQLTFVRDTFQPEHVCHMCSWVCLSKA